MESKNNSSNLLRPLFLPAISLLNRISYTKKFTLLWLLTMIAIAVMAYSLIVSLGRVIHPMQRQLEGIALIKPVTRTMQAIQLHSGASTALLGGNESMRDRLAASEKEAAAAFNAMEEKLPAGFSAGKEFSLIKSNWERLRKEGLNLPLAKNFAAHIRLIEHIQQFEVLIADEYLLTMDSELDTFYLTDTALDKLPHTLERLEQIRAYGTNILYRKKITKFQKAYLSVRVAELENSLDLIASNLEKSGRYNPEIQKLLKMASDDIAGSSRHITGLMTSDIFDGRFATTPDAFLEITTTEIDKGYAQMYNSLLPTAESLFKARISKAKNALYMSAGVGLLAFLVVVYFSVCMYYAIIGSIQTLARSAHSFAAGNLRERIIPGTNDELSQVGDSFNEMADGFNAMLEARREDEARLRATFETAMDAVVQMNSEGYIIGWNNQAENIFGWSRDEAIGRALHETIIPPMYRDAHVQGLKRFLLTGKGAMLNSRTEIVGLHRDGHEFPIELAIASIMTNGKYEFSAFLRDITKRKETDNLIWKQANFDVLTGLPNRRMFHDRLAQEIRKAHRSGLKMALLYIDLDKFKEINDMLGHSIGDTILIETAHRISGCVRDADVVARLGGDEFTVILSELADAGSIERVVEDIMQKLIEPFQLGDEVTYISASIGITVYPDDATKSESLLKNADQAMYMAKNKGRNRFCYFTPAMQQAAQTRMLLINELRSALATNQFSVHYQPIMDLATGRINKAEALLRWCHPKLGMIEPAQFIPLAEETGMILEIGDWVFKESARQLKHWQNLLHTELRVSVNVSPLQFSAAGDQHKKWFAYLHEIGMKQHCIVIEITEGLLLDAESGMAGKLLEFRDEGIQASIDDFGTGYSSLSYLKRFDIDFLKIDQSFVRDLESDPDDMALSEAIIVMAHKLGLKVIAEGVETEEQRRLLADAGCDYAQGYLFSRPLPADEFEKMLKESRF